MHKKKGMEKILIINKFIKQIKSKSSQTVKRSNSQSPQVVKEKKKGGNEEIQKYIGFFFYILLTSLPSA